MFTLTLISTSHSYVVEFESAVDHRYDSPRYAVDCSARSVRSGPVVLPHVVALPGYTTTPASFRVHVTYYTDFRYVSPAWCTFTPPILYVDLTLLHIAAVAIRICSFDLPLILPRISVTRFPRDFMILLHRSFTILDTLRLLLRTPPLISHLHDFPLPVTLFTDTFLVTSGYRSTHTR